VDEYLSRLKNGDNPIPPEISIELYFSGKDYPLFEGNGNSERANKCGISVKVEIAPEYQNDYETLIKQTTELITIPIEYFHIVWKSFAREIITTKNIPLKSVLIDSSSIKYYNGSDIYLSRIINNDLDETEKVQLSQAYRKIKDAFMADPAVDSINEKINSSAGITSKKLSVSVDLSTQNSWETALMTYLDEIPFHQIGKGEQCIIKTNLALSDQKGQDAKLILIEEPENHLSHTKLNELIRNISEGCENKQVIMSTHSSFVANKLGLDRLILLNNQKVTRLSDSEEGTYAFFQKLAGYQTLRLLLCRKAVLVEGDSDELIFQKAYMDSNNGKLPIQDGIDIISAKLTFKRFLEIAAKINQPVAVITDNDGNYSRNITEKYQGYLNYLFIKIFADNRDTLPTLEPQFVDANVTDLETLCKVLAFDFAKFDTCEKITEHMIADKTSWALKVFNSVEKIKYPKYILDAVAWCNENK
jgi:putative ATP-dependent endonuclease of OLD family